MTAESGTPRTDRLARAPYGDDLAQAANRMMGLARSLERETVELANTVLALQAENEKLRKDAARYRWLRKERKDKAGQGSYLIRMGTEAFAYELPAEAELDAAIDAALAQREGTP